MLKVGNVYSLPKLAELFETQNKQGIERKMQRYGIEYVSSGHGLDTTYKIKKIENPFKVYAITELGYSANSDFIKVRNFYWYYFNDDVFMAMPDEVKETMLRNDYRDISRQTIARYTQKLVVKNMINLNTGKYIYYFALNGNQRIVDALEYKQAWKDYWSEELRCLDTRTRISQMISKYGGVARKQAIPEINGIYNEEIEYMCSLIHRSIENEIQ